MPEPLEVRPGQKVFWDNRFIIDINVNQKSVILKPIGLEDLKKIIKMIGVRKKTNRPIEVLYSLPILCHKTNIVGVPDLEFAGSSKNFKQLGFELSYFDAKFGPRNSLGGSVFSLIN